MVFLRKIKSGDKKGFIPTLIQKRRPLFFGSSGFNVGRESYMLSGSGLAGGFTLIEVTVVIVIFSILSAISIFNYRDFDNSVKLKNQAMSVALAIKLAQANALSSRQLGGFLPYGVYFDTTTPNKIISFIDDNIANDRMYGGSDTINEQLLLDNGYTINKLCADSGSGCTLATTLHVSYLRPNIDAKICLGSDCATGYTQAQIVLVSPKGATSTVFVTNLGQIYVQ